MPSWIRCPCCDDYWCIRHQMHAHDCRCPAIEEWEGEAYFEPGRDRLMLDLFAGLGGASQSMKERGWEVVTVDNDAAMKPDIVADLSSWSWEGPSPTLVWASPPCTEFSRESMPWTRTGRTPDLGLLLASLRIIRECKPAFWVLENVRGAIRYFRPLLGDPVQSHGPFFLWGKFPNFRARVSHFKEKLAGRQRAQRARLPVSVSMGLAVAIEEQLAFV